MPIEIVSDLRATSSDVAEAIVRSWMAQDATAAVLDAATVVVAPELADTFGVLPQGWRVLADPLPDGFWDRTLAAAGQRGRAVLALLGPVLGGMDAVGVLLDVLDADPMFGTAIARELCRDGCCVRALAAPDGAAVAWMPQEVLAELAPHDVIGDLLAPALLIRPLLLTEFGDTEPPFTSLAGTLLHRIGSARRCGFRTVVANRAVLRGHDADCALTGTRVLSPSPRDLDRLRPFETDRERGWREFGGASVTLFEGLAGRHLQAQRGGTRPSLLLDMRNLGATYNGTSFAALGAANGLHRAGIDWEVTILGHEDGARFHDFAGTFPGWTVATPPLPPTAAFNVALRLSQPWHIQEMVDLHRAARLNAYLMLDTIAWDIVYAAPPHLDGTWQFLSASADGLLFISEFSRQRFKARFPAAAHTATGVCHLSFNPQDYTRDDLLGAEPSNYFLVIGNHLDHKDVAATTELLASAFPLTPIATLGPSRWRSPNITAHQSGTLAEGDVQKLYASAKLAIFPSFYEGFGLPIVAALAYGRTLLARDSDLLQEIAPLCQPTGRLIPYRRRDELVDLIGRLKHGLPVAERPLGAALNGAPPRSWVDVGRQIDAFLRDLMTSADSDAWKQRDRAVRQALACRT